MNEYLIKLMANGGPGSGNHSPGQGRGVGKPSKGSSRFSKGQEVEFEFGGGKGTGKIVRKLTDKEKEDRAFLANPDAGDYYEVEGKDGYKTIVWDAKIKSSKSEKGSVGPAKITKKDVQDLLKPGHNRYTREVTDVKYNPDRDRYEADVVTKYKDGTQNDEFWFTMPGKDPNEGMSWLTDNSPTFIEEFTEKMKKVFTE